MLMRMAWRNIWRNPRRSLITLAAMTFTLTLMIVSSNLIEGMNRQMVGYAADRSLGHIQAHAEGYYKDKGLYDTLPISVLDRFKGSAFRAAPRAYAYGLASLGDQSAGVLIRGIDPLQERRVTELWKHMLQGSYFQPGEEKVIILGRKIAKTLNAQPGSEIALITQAADGSLGNDLYRVVGVLKTLDDATDRTAVIMPLADFGEMLVLPGRIHEVAIRTPNAIEVDRYKPQVVSLLEGKGCEVRTWKEIAPALKDALALNEAWTTIMLLIVFSIASLGILNTMLMAVFERMYELGLMLAVGLKPLRMVRLIFVETLMLAGISEVLGLGLGLLWSWRLVVKGWDLTGLFGEGFEYTGFAIENVLRAAIWPEGMLQCMAIMLIISGLAGLYPSVKAARLKPVEVMRI
jgi:ABC-type lipoprotein release transport system permease subunit